MTKESVQFVELVRRAALQAEPLKLRRWCAVCGKFTDHESRESGDYETITCCACGAKLVYRVR